MSTIHFEPPAQVRVETVAGGNVALVSLAGEIDLRVHSDLRELFWRQIDAGRGLIVDLRGVEFLDSTAIGLLIGALRRLREHAQPDTPGMVLVVEGGEVERTLTLTGLHRVFQITATPEDAECVI